MTAIFPIGSFRGGVASAGGAGWGGRGGGGNLKSSDHAISFVPDAYLAAIRFTLIVYVYFVDNVYTLHFVFYLCTSYVYRSRYLVVLYLVVNMVVAVRPR